MGLGKTKPSFEETNKESERRQKGQHPALVSLLQLFYWLDISSLFWHQSCVWCRVTISCHLHLDTGAHIGVERCINAYLKVNSYWIWIHLLGLVSWDPYSKLMLFRGWQQIICRMESNKTSCIPSNIWLLISFFDLSTVHTPHHLL